MTIVIRKCVPRPAANPRSDGRKLFLEADVVLAMDQAGLDELRTLAMNGRDFHLVAGEPPKREAEREAREVEFLREESKTFRLFRESAERELERLRARLMESERRYQILQQEVVRREQSKPLSLGLPPPPGAKLSPLDVRKALLESLSDYSKMGFISSIDPSTIAPIAPTPLKYTWSASRMQWDMASQDAIQSIEKAIYGEWIVDPPKQQEPAPEKVGERFRSIEFDEDEEN